jgi:hypothetical protein
MKPQFAGAMAMQQEQSPDAKLIAQLAKSGADLEKLHSFDFVLRFPTQKSAERAEGELMGFAFDTRTEKGKTDAEWIVHAGKVMYPNEPDLSGLRDKLDAIAERGHGAYEGWKAKVFVRKPGG